MQPIGFQNLGGGHMNAKQPDRRQFLKDGAALVGLAVGGVRSATAQTPASEPHPPEAHSKNIKELIAYGERSRFVNSIRVPVDTRPSPDAFGLTFHILT